MNVDINNENKNEAFNPSRQETELSSDNIFSKIKRYLRSQSPITLAIAGTMFIILLITAGVYAFDLQRKSTAIDSKPSPTQVPVSPTNTPSPSPTSVLSPTKTDTTTGSSVLTSSPTSTPTTAPLGITLHLLDDKTKTPIIKDGIKVTITGQGINQTVENQAEVHFALSSSGMYEVILVSPPTGGYTPNGGYCSDNSKCWGTGSYFCGTKVEVTQGNMDVYCTYNKVADPTSTPTQSVSLSSIEPNSGSVMSSITLRGSNFGTSNGSVTFYNSNGQASGGAPISSWSDTEVKANVPGILAGNSTYQVEVENSNGSKSNRVSFTVN